MQSELQTAVSPPVSQSPLEDAWGTDHLTYELHPRVAASIQKMRDGGESTQQLDLFSESRWSTAADDPRAAWLQTLRATTSLAVLESELMSGPSTVEVLEGETLAAFDPGSVRSQAGLDPLESRKWAALENPFGPDTTLLAPLRPVGFWAVHEGTGSVIGILGDGSGGAAEGICDAYDSAKSAIAGLSLAGGIAGASVGGWVELAKWEVESLTMASLVLFAGGTAGDISNPAGAMGCGIAAGAAGSVVPAFEGYMMVTDALDTAGVDHGLPDACGGGSGGCG